MNIKAPAALPRSINRLMFLSSAMLEELKADRDFVEHMLTMMEFRGMAGSSHYRVATARAAALQQIIQSAEAVS